jgi:hypothetical protein
MGTSSDVLQTTVQGTGRGEKQTDEPIFFDFSRE